MLIYPNALHKLETVPQYQQYLQLVRDLLPYLGPVRFGIKRHEHVPERLTVARPVCVFWVGNEVNGSLRIGWRKQGWPGFTWGSEVHSHTCSAPIQDLRRVLTMKRVPIWVNAEPLP